MDVKSIQLTFPDNFFLIFIFWEFLEIQGINFESCFSKKVLIWCLTLTLHFKITNRGFKGKYQASFVWIWQKNTSWKNSRWKYSLLCITCIPCTKIIWAISFEMLQYSLELCVTFFRGVLVCGPWIQFSNVDCWCSNLLSVQVRASILIISFCIVDVNNRSNYFDYRIWTSTETN